jgi:hypothetical protein
MVQYGIPRRSFAPQIAEVAPFNWRRGLYRIWLLLTVGWVMSWAIYLTMGALEGKFTNVFAIPIVLFGPPVAFLIFAIAAGWAIRGFVVPTGSFSTER